MMSLQEKIKQVIERKSIHVMLNAKFYGWNTGVLDNGRMYSKDFAMIGVEIHCASYNVITIKVTNYISDKTLVKNLITVGCFYSEVDKSIDSITTRLVKDLL